VISFSKISKQYGRQILFVDASFQLNPGEKVGLVGPNGAGKTTIFRMIVGEESVDEGDVSVPRKLSVGYFRQDVEEMSGRSVLDEAIAGSGRLGDLHHELEALQNAMADPAKAGDMDRILARFGEALEGLVQSIHVSLVVARVVKLEQFCGIRRRQGVKRIAQRRQLVLDGMCVHFTPVLNGGTGPHNPWKRGRVPVPGKFSSACASWRDRRQAYRRNP
jgi:ATPase subunit of ABC transporter with duplicated ATPase domains